MTKQINEELMKEYEELLFRKDNLVKEAEKIYYHYMKEFGEEIVQSFEAKMRCIQKKKQITYCQKRKNKGLPINALELEKYTQEQMLQYQKELEQLLIDYGVSTTMSPISVVDYTAIKKLYYKLARLIHPDMRPDLKNDKTIQSYWKEIASAYKNNDFDKLVDYEFLVMRYLKENNLDNYEWDSIKISNRLIQIKDEIQQIISTTPYQYRFLLDDEEACQQKHQELQDEINNYNDYEKQLDELLSQFDIQEMFS